MAALGRSGSPLRNRRWRGRSPPEPDRHCRGPRRDRQAGYPRHPRRSTACKWRSRLRGFRSRGSRPDRPRGRARSTLRRERGKPKPATSLACPSRGVHLPCHNMPIAESRQRSPSMHTHSLDRWHHAHVFLGEQHDRHERRTWFVVALTAATMVAEITGGTLFGSLAVVADGVHMSTHVAALAIAALAYRFARRHAADARFSFGTGKLGELAAFASALILLLIALLIAYESITRFFNPIAIRYNEAIAVACIGLAVNLVSAWLLSDEDHQHGHAHDDESDHHHHSH